MIVHRQLRAALRGGIYYLVLAAAALPFVLPLWYLAMTAFKPARQIFSSPPTWFPDPLTVENFGRGWTLLDFPAFFRSSLLVSGVVVAGTLLSSSLVGYAFATLPSRGKDVLFAILLGTVMVPSTVTLIPVFIGFSRLGWTNSYIPLVLPSFGANAFYVFLFRQYFRTIPQELFECAELDGCNPWTAFWHVGIPLAHPALAAVGVFSFIASWNDFLNPLVYLSTNNKFTLSLGLSLFNGLYYTQTQYLMPMSLVALLPVTLVFLAAQRFLVNGIVTTRY